MALLCFVQVPGYEDCTGSRGTWTYPLNLNMGTLAILLHSLDAGMERLALVPLGNEHCETPCVSTES